MRREVIGSIELTCEDCMELMGRYPDKYFNLAIIDPPYGINISSNIGRRSRDGHTPYAKIKWDNDAPDESFFNELYRVSQNYIIWGANHFIERVKPCCPCWIVWDKKFSEEVSFASFEMAYTSFDSVCKLVSIHPDKREKIHPIQKPVTLYKWLLSKFAKPGDKILDTHLGSGSHAIACYDMGFRLTACEIDEDYFTAAVERLRLFQAQGVLDFGDVCMNKAKGNMYE
jgi:site-specific DNA-methyltransferase (adenine-specific)